MGKGVQNGFRIPIILRICTRLKNVIFKTGKLQHPHAFIGINGIKCIIVLQSLISRNNDLCLSFSFQAAEQKVIYEVLAEFDFHAKVSNLTEMTKVHIVCITCMIANDKMLQYR